MSTSETKSMLAQLTPSHFCDWGGTTSGPVVCIVCEEPYRKPVYRNCPGKPQPKEVFSVQPIDPKDAAANPGTELKKLLRKIGITATANCKCNKRAVIMDIEGPDWCQEHLEDIVDWMEEEAANQGKLFVRTAGKLLVKLAIYRARKRARMYP